jgi:Tfp pilus assembly PilM family ATPase
MELPARLSGAPAEQIVRMELSRLHTIPPDSFEMAYWNLQAANPSRPVTHALAVACPHAAANAILDIFEGAGFHVTALDVRSAAAARACGPLVLPAPQITAIMDLGWQATTLLFVCGRSLVYERSLDSASMADLAAKLAEAFKIPLESAAQVLGTIGTAGKGPSNNSIGTAWRRSASI